MTYFRCASHGSPACSPIFSGIPVALAGPSQTIPSRCPMVSSPVSPSSSPPPERLCASCRRHKKRAGRSSRTDPPWCSAFPTPPWMGARGRRQTDRASSSSISINRTERVYRGSAAPRKPASRGRTPGRRVRSRPGMRPSGSSRIPVALATAITAERGSRGSWGRPEPCPALACSPAPRGRCLRGVLPPVSSLTARCTGANRVERLCRSPSGCRTGIFMSGDAKAVTRVVVSGARPVHRYALPRRLRRRRRRRGSAPPRRRGGRARGRPRRAMGRCRRRGRASAAKPCGGGRSRTCRAGSGVSAKWLYIARRGRQGRKTPDFSGANRVWPTDAQL